MKSILFIAIQYLLPHHLLSRVVGWFASTKIHWIKKHFIEFFAAHYNVNMTEAKDESLDSYSSFNAFFCRQLKPEARPLAENNTLICPADGSISQVGRITDTTIFQAKGKSFSVEALLGGDTERAKPFINGSFCTIYLSPKDYHRVHMPIKGRLLSMIHVPGKLFSVNPTTVNNVDHLFARNERVISIFDTEAGPVAVVLVGAMIVASIETVWAGEVAPRNKHISVFDYVAKDPVTLDRGEEMGRFKLGSTAILLLPKDSTEWLSHIQPEQPVCMGEALANTIN